MELEEEGRGFGKRCSLVGVDRLDAGSIKEFAASHGNPGAHHGGGRRHAVGQGVEAAIGRGHAFRYPEHSQREFGDDSKGSLGSDQQARKVVTGRVFPRGPARVNHCAVSKYCRQRQHVVAHRSVTNGGRARGARRRHPPQRRIGTGVDREEQAVAGKALVQRDATQPGLDDDQQVVRSHLENCIHLRQVDRDSALDREHVPFER